MNPILTDYIARFQKEPISYPEQFYTQLSLQEYTTKLPYIFEVEVFCLRLLKAYLKGEKICIYSDYDTDAVTATATMYWGLVDMGFDKNNLTFYAPDRFIEGYGMNPEAVEKLVQACDLIVSVDCGINSVAEAEVVRQSSCDLIITDHHSTAGVIPEAMGVINPRLSQFYYQNNSVFETRNSYTNQVKERLIQEIVLFNTINQIGLYNWLAKLTLQPSDYQLSSRRFLSASVTGVGVAWFCLVWLGYMLEELQVS